MTTRKRKVAKPVVSIACELPMLPNFIRARRDNAELCIDVADVSEYSLRELGALWTEALVKHSRKRKQDCSLGGER